MTPFYYITSLPRVFLAFYGYVSYNRVQDSYGVRPVINLKSTTTFLDNNANGSIEQPYIVKT